MEKGNAKRLVIIGAGISGMSAGIYACKAGFDVTILEKTHSAGGLSSSWKRKGYTIEGGIHWLTGSSPALPQNRIWKDVGALCENNPIQDRDPLFILVEKDRRIPFYRDPGKMAETLIGIAPEDEKAIRRLERHIRSMEKFHTPISNIKGLKTTNPIKVNRMEVIRDFLPAILALPSILTKSVSDYICQFKNESVRALLGCFLNHQQNAISLIFTLGTFASGDGGYPKGGSLVLSGNMEKKYLSLGGRILHDCEASRVVIDNKKVTGVRYNNDKFIPADAVIISANARMAIDNLFEQPLQDKWARKMRQKMDMDQCLIFSMGVKTDLSSCPRNMAFRLDQALEYAGCWSDVLLLYIYNGEEYAPEGCTVITSLLFGDMYEYWLKAKSEGTYSQKKQEIAERVTSLIQSYLPLENDRIEFTDIATPLTLQRYCSTYKGGFMSLWRAGEMPANAPLRHDRISGLYFAGQQTDFAGGLPVAVT
ncbi:MAG: phytoene desaturase family protein, partial [Candidatus Cryptobacteroides sp.]